MGQGSQHHLLLSEDFLYRNQSAIRREPPKKREQKTETLLILYTIVEVLYFANSCWDLLVRMEML